ncbi:MAG TPA: 6-phosphogluconolactonase [Aldersonia sp.]
MSDPVVDRYPDAEALAAAAAERFVNAVVAAQVARGSAAVVLTGGGAGIRTLELIRANPGDIDWSALDVFWGDERFVPADDPERNELQGRQALLDHVPVDHARVHPMAASDGEYPDPVAAAAEYARLLSSFGEQFDVHLLGMGGEGHINSLFPHTDAVREEHELVVAVLDSPKPPPVRITLTLPAVRRSRQVWLLVAGEAKAEAVAAAIGGAKPDDWPCAGARGSEGTVWFVDDAAASRL